MKQFIDFTDKVCLVTGAGSENGIGFKTAEILGLLGGRVIMVSTTERILERERELKKQGIRVKGKIADLMDRSQVKSLIQDIIAVYGKIDVWSTTPG